MEKIVREHLDYLKQVSPLPVSQDFRQLDDQLAGWLFTALNLNDQTGNTWPEVEFISPRIVLYVIGAAGGRPENSLKLAAAVQLLHQAGTLFDDIQDQDQPQSLPAAVGLPGAMDLAMILLGSGLYSLGEVVYQAGNGNTARLISGIYPALVAGFRGQLLDLQEKAVPPRVLLANPEAYLRKTQLKSALIMGFLAEAGALLAGADPATCTVYQCFGHLYGLALQLLDDLAGLVVDLYRGEIPLDLRERHSGLVYCKAWEALPGEKQQKVLDLWAGTGTGGGDLELAGLLVSEKAFLQTLAIGTGYLAEAESELRRLDPELETLEHRLLLEMLQQLVRRIYTYFSKCSLTSARPDFE